MKTYIFAIIGVSLIIFLATSIDTYNQNLLAQQGLSGLNNDIFYKTFGEFKDYLSDISYLKADLYYHGGTYDFRKYEEARDEGLHIEEEMDHAHKGIHAHKHKKTRAETRPSLNILLDIGKAAGITEHRHLSGNEEKEIVPWIYYAIRLNSHNKSAYSVGGFWLAVKLKKPDRAIKFLKEGLINNPGSWEICETLGQTYFFNKKDYENALIYLEKAKELGDKQNIDKFEKRKIYILLAEVYKKAGDIAKSNELYKELPNLSPHSQPAVRK